MLIYNNSILSNIQSSVLYYIFWNSQAFFQHCIYLAQFICLHKCLTFSLQYYSPTGLPAKRLDPNMCAICGNEIYMMNNDEAVIEKFSKLNCGHVYPFKTDSLGEQFSLIVGQISAQKFMNCRIWVKSTKFCSNVRVASQQISLSRQFYCCPNVGGLEGFYCTLYLFFSLSPFVSG